ncbi:CMD domain protein [Brucella sp. IR073]|uniref:CMD domain protein n=1 Tax=unclassified Brucella TaxID=2632610 RepID=UPI003B985F42
MSEHADIIDHLAGVDAASPLEALRARRPITKANAQASWNALFEPVSPSDVTLAERFAVALFVSLLHGQREAAEFYAGKLRALPDGTPLADIVTVLADEAATTGPYGDYPAGPLSAENKPGLAFSVAGKERAIVEERLAAALEHSHLLVFHPRDANPARLQKLLDAGWTTTGIVTLSQLVSFLAFQLRVVSGLKVLADA